MFDARFIATVCASKAFHSCLPSCLVNSLRRSNYNGAKLFSTQRSTSYSLSAVWPDLAKFRHFGKTYSDFGKILMVYLVFGKILTLLCQEFYVIGRIFIAVNGQILNSYQAIWSLWSEFWIVDFKGLLPTYLGEVKPSWTYYTISKSDL